MQDGKEGQSEGNEVENNKKSDCNIRYRRGCRAVDVKTYGMEEQKRKGRKKRN